MTNFIRMHAIVMGLLLDAAIVSAGANPTPSVLEDVRYAVQPTYSRVTLHFQGDISYTAVQQENRIMLGFRRTRVASPPGAARLEFKTGHVRGLTIERVTTDSTRVVIALKDRMTYRIVQPKAENQIYMDVSLDTAQATPITMHPPVKAVAKPETASRNQERKSQLVDIPGIARKQMDEANQRTESRVEPLTGKDSLRVREEPGKTAEPERAGTSSLSPMFLILAVVLIAAFTTGVLLYVASRRQMGVIASPQKQEIRPPVISTPTRGSLPTPRALIPEVEHEDEVSRIESAERDEDPTQLARIYGRGQSELDLALRLRGSAAAGLTSAKMQQALRATKSRTQQLNAARKLGVGRGELELALNLDRLRHLKARKEVVS